jgi:hypothetical protein
MCQRSPQSLSATMTLKVPEPEAMFERVLTQVKAMNCVRRQEFSYIFNIFFYEYILLMGIFINFDLFTRKIA